MELNNIIFSFLLPIFVFLISKYLLHVFNSKKINILNDDEFNKPQAFHENSTFRLGGLIIFLSLSVVFLYLFLSNKYYFPEYISFSILFFFLGFFDDLKIDIKQSHPNVTAIDVEHTDDFATVAFRLGTGEDNLASFVSVEAATEAAKRLGILEGFYTITKEEGVYHLKVFRDKINPANYDGAILLGVNGISIKSHGNASPYAFSYALDKCYNLIKNNFNMKIRNNLTRL